MVVRERPRIGKDIFSINERKIKTDQELSKTFGYLALSRSQFFYQRTGTNQWNASNLVVQVGEFQQ